MAGGFHIQINVDFVVLANVVKGLEITQGRMSYKTLNALGQAAFKIAETSLMRKIPEGQEITSIEEALEYLESEAVTDRNSSSINTRGGIRKGGREAKEEMFNEGFRYIDTKKDKDKVKHKITQEEIDNYDPETYTPIQTKVDPALAAHLSQEMLRMRNEKRMEDRPKVIPGTADEWNRLAAERGNPTLHPDRTKTTPDVDETLSTEEKIQRLREREKENI